jgi:hypothetical protein
MSRKAERENQILKAIEDRREKTELMAQLIGVCYSESAAKSVSRAYRNLTKKGLIAAEGKTVLRGYKIVVETWVKRIVPQINDCASHGTIRMTCAVTPRQGSGPAWP